MQNVDKLNCFTDCKNLDANRAIIDFNSKEIKLGEVQLSQHQIEKFSFLLAHDLKAFAETGGNTATLSANSVYSHLKNNQ